jgi:hypothetical protein
VLPVRLAALSQGHFHQDLKSLRPRPADATAATPAP